MAATKKRSYSTPALDKGLDIIELLAHEPVGLIKSEIARRLNRSVSEIFRMLLTLEGRGYIAQSDNERYSLTLHLFHLVQEHPPTERLLAEALPVMRELALAVHQSCHLGVVEGSHVVILAQINGPDPNGFYVRVGSVIDLMRAATGQVILAHQTTAMRDQILNRWKASMGKPVPRDVLPHLKKIKQRGYEERASYQVQGIVNMSVPILDRDGSALGALTVPYIKRLDSISKPPDTLSLLQAACRKIAESIGRRPEFPA